MSLPVQPEPDNLVVPLTGEVVSLEDASQVAKAHVWVRDTERKLREVRRVLTEALVEHSRNAGTKTLHIDGLPKPLVVRGGPESEIVWDVEALRVLLDMGLPAERFSELVSEEVAYRVNANVAKSIASANPDYARVISAAQTRVDKPWSVS